MKKINLIQFMPYFPPHRGGVEVVGEEIGKYWVKNNYGEFINLVSEFEQDLFLSNKKNEKIIFDNEIIGYKKDGFEVLVIPSIEIIYNFPIYKIWDKKYKIIIKYLKTKLDKNYKVITHTRFFLTSLIGGIFARKNKIKWIHLEHGSDYVKFGSKIKTILSIIYDKTFGKYIFKTSDKLLSISNASKNFIINNFVNRYIDIFYRGLDLNNINIKKTGDVKLVYIGRLVGLKGVSDLITAYKKSGINNKLIIIGDGDEKENLIYKSKGLNIDFLGFKSREYILEYLSNNNCVVINPSYSEGMPTTVIESLSRACPVVATNVGGTSEISDLNDLILTEPGNIELLSEKIIYSIDNYMDIKGLSLDLINKRFNRKTNIEKLYNLVK